MEAFATETDEGSAEDRPRRSADVFIEVSGLHKSFGSNEVLRGIELQIRVGEIFTLLGGSGTGKSVLLKHMIGLMRPDRGSIRVAGQDTSDFRERDWVEVRKRIGYVFQGAALFDSLSVFDNVAYALREHRRMSRAEIAQRVADCLDAVGLAGIESLMPAELSGGMRKRVAVARAIVLEPEAIFYDEPTTGLDPANARRIGQLIESLRDRLGVTSIVVTHDLELCFAISDRIGLLAEGTLVAQGTPDAIRASTRPEVRAFLSGGSSLEADSVWRTREAGAVAPGEDVEVSERGPGDGA
jgi:phospholipid/cholesterol/gamma-HCH transport system ATP-binding protein